jgi:hypothetical protein
MIRHLYLLHIKQHCSIYWRGSYCWLEFDLIHHGTNYVLQLFTKKGLYNYFTAPF